MSSVSSNTTKRTRKPSCTLCSNHGKRKDLKGHKYVCEFSDCECDHCDRGRERRKVMREQVKLRRHQMREIYASKPPAKGSGNKVETSSQTAPESPHSINKVTPGI